MSFKSQWQPDVDTLEENCFSVQYDPNNLGLASWLICAKNIECGCYNSANKLFGN